MKDPIIPLLVNVKNYREFITVKMKGHEGARQLTWAELSRRAGFSSRSYPSDVVSGHRRITATSLPGFIKGLGLKGDLKTLFTLLVSQEEDLEIVGVAQDNIARNLEKVRERLLSRFENRETSDRVYSQRYWLEVYAALGSPSEGATLSEVAGKTKLPREECLRVLEKMEAAGLVRLDYQNKHFIAVENHIAFDKLGESDFFRKHFINSLQELSRQATPESFKKQDRLFLTSVFSISQHRATEFKKELRELIVRFVDSSENAKGDSIAKVVVGFLPEVMTR